MSQTRARPKPKHRALTGAPTTVELSPSTRVVEAKEPIFWSGELIAIVIIGALLRLRYLNQPMRYDESVTYLNFVAGSWSSAVSAYTYPNNHVFHTLLAKVCVVLFGNVPWAIRMPALLAGIAMIPWTFSVGRRLVGETAAYLGAAFVASSGALTLYSTNARGYTILCLATLVLADLMLRLRERPSLILWTATAVVAPLAMWTIPVMVFPAGGLALWWLVLAVSGNTRDRRSDLKKSALVIVATILITAVLYSPVISSNGLTALTDNAFVKASRWPVFFDQLPRLVRDMVSGWSLGLPALLAVPIAVAAAAVGLVESARHHQRTARLVGCVYVWCAFVLLVTHRIPFARVFLFLLAPAALLVAAGLISVGSRLPELAKRLQTHAAATALAFTMCLAGVVALSGEVATTRDTGTLRDAEAIARDLARNLRPGDRVIAPIPSNAPLSYYLERDGVDASYLTSTPSDSGNVYLVVNTAEGFTLNTPLTERFARPAKNAQLIARYSAAELYRLF